MNQEVLSAEKLADLLMGDVALNGERVWDLSVHATDPNISSRRYVFSKPLVYTTHLARDLVKPTTQASEPDGWVVSRVSDREWRLYLRVGETYSESGSRILRPPIKIAIRSLDEFLRLFSPPKTHWWEAPFVCPYCSFLCAEGNCCDHLVISRNFIQPRFRNPKLELLFTQMWDRKFNCSIQNAKIEGLSVKTPRVFHYSEWFRFAYWYVQEPSIAGLVESALEKAAQVQAL